MDDTKAVDENLLGSTMVTIRRYLDHFPGGIDLSAEELCFGCDTNVAAGAIANLIDRALAQKWNATRSSRLPYYYSSMCRAGHEQIGFRSDGGPFFDDGTPCPLCSLVDENAALRGRVERLQRGAHDAQMAAWRDESEAARLLYAKRFSRAVANALLSVAIENGDITESEIDAAIAVAENEMGHEA